MTGASDMAVIVLGAGASRRFGAMDKLNAPLDGRPLAHHPLAVLDGFDWAERCLVVAGPAPWHTAYRTAGFTLHRNPEAETGMAGSLQLGASATTAQKVLIALADMPDITTAHIEALVQASKAHPDRLIASAAEGLRGPPVIAPRRVLSGLSGDQGLRPLLPEAILVNTTTGVLKDIDTPGDLRG